MRNAGIYLMGVLYVAAGINHFIHPDMYKRIMPRWIPEHTLMVALSGVAEIVLGCLLLPSLTRPYAAWGIIALLIAVFPANIQMAFYWQRTHHPHLWIAWLRLPLQGLLIFWAWKYTQEP